MSASTTQRPTSAGSDFAALNRQIVDAGLLDRRPAYYAVRMIVVTAMFAGGWVAFGVTGSSWWTLLVAAFMGVAFAQVGLLAHDVAHRQVFRTKKPSALMGRILANIGVAMSYGWWMDKHTRHHNNPNHDDLDPDVQPELLIWATESAWGRRGVKGFINRHQAGLFFPLLTLLSIDLRVSSVKALRRPGMKRRGLEAGLMALHLVGYATALLVVLSPLQALAFFLVHHAVFGVYLGMTFAPMQTVAMRQIEPRMAGAASGLINTTRQLGAVIGSASVGALLQNQLAVKLAAAARAHATQLPPQVLDRFTHTSGSNLEVGAGQRGVNVGNAQLPPAVQIGRAHV